MDTTSRTTLDEAFDSELTGDRTPSAAMLAWFLLHVERLDPELVPDAICDGRGDKGIDALIVDDEQSEIVLFQGKRMESATKTQGDNDLRHLLGAANYFVDEKAVEGLLASKPNHELRNLLTRNNVAQKVASGYKVRRLVLVTNASLDASAQGLLDAVSHQEPTLDVWHQDKLVAVAERVRRADLREETVSIRPATPVIAVDLEGEAKMAIALVRAHELVGLPGIEDLTLFARNVRLSAGNTRINKELAATVADPKEHALFPAAHNGITVLTNGLTIGEADIRLNGLSVVNGCQSLLALHRGRGALTPQLKILVKIVELPSRQSYISDTITYRANNQNAVNIRDQRSTDGIQLGLYRAVREEFGGEFEYVIKIGQTSQAARTLDNTLAAQLITAVLREKPWAAVRKVRLFDQDYHNIFAPDVNAHVLFLLELVNEACNVSREHLEGELKSAFASVRFTVAALVADVLRLSDRGAQLLADPSAWLPAKQQEVLSWLSERARDVVGNINGYVVDAATEAQEEKRDFDAKTVFKSASGIAPLRREIATVSRRVERREPGYLFDLAPSRL
ncbi:AIPR family protein [Cellulomonas pakistanensis]|uniref:Abortive phage infection protein C-terminal domain-containing protein n=1 Tax=Cellulomonas pakistanensis TaxID=992287 RepID=A0A919P9V8_9CELL|nr:AIPR family protein [Cellulomonas pakistanensis]GIG36298.1 hypothetical protein Cpa01nite_16790 [Cellulomonas pakistanensis]